MNKWNILKGVLSIVIIGLLFWKLDVHAVYNTLINMNGGYLIPIIFFGWFGLFFGCIDFYLLIRVLGYKIKFFDVFKYSSVAWSFSLLMPGRLGDFSLVYFFSKKGLTYGESSAVFVFSRALTMISLAIIFSIGVVWFFPLKSFIIGLVIFWALIVLGCVCMFTNPGWKLFSKLIPKRFKEKFELYYSSIKFFIYKKPWSILAVFIIVFLQRCLNGIFFYYILTALGQNVSLIVPIVINAVEIVSGIIPITLGGLGVKESVGAGLYSLQGIAPEVIGAMYALSIFFTYFTGAIVMLLWGGSIGKENV